MNSLGRKPSIHKLYNSRSRNPIHITVMNKYVLNAMVQKSIATGLQRYGKMAVAKFIFHDRIFTSDWFGIA